MPSRAVPLKGPWHYMASPFWGDFPPEFFMAILGWELFTYFGPNFRLRRLWAPQASFNPSGAH